MFLHPIVTAWICQSGEIFAFLMNVVKSTSMCSQGSSPSVMHSVASAHTPPYLWSRRTLITSLFACNQAYREVNKRLVNVFKQDPGSVRQNS